MIAYRSALNGTGEEYDYTVKLISNGEEIIAPGSCKRMFYNNITFNEPVTIGNNVGVTDFMFANALSFNQSVNMSPNIYSANCMFWNATNFTGAGSSIILGNAYVPDMFAYCSKFNAPVTFAENTFLDSIAEMFKNCSNFNTQINLPPFNSGYAAFSGCSKFNQPITINGNNVSNMFANCTNLNSKVTIIHGNNFDSMFLNCSIFNQSIELPAFKNARFMLCNCYEFGNNIYFKHNSSDLAISFNLSYMLQNTNRQKRKNLFMNNAIYNGWRDKEFICVNEQGATCILDPMTNGYYNAYFNVYVYTNYNG